MSEVVNFHECRVRRLVHAGVSVRVHVIQALCPGLPLPETPGQGATLDIPPRHPCLTPDGIRLTMLVDAAGAPAEVFVPWRAVYRVEER